MLRLTGVAKRHHSPRHVRAIEPVAQSLSTRFDRPRSDEFEADPRRRMDQGQLRASNECSLFGDTIEELSTWHWSEESFEDVDDPGLLDAIDPLAPITNPFRNVGHNDPCPCGSGKKIQKVLPPLGNQMDTYQQCHAYD